MKDVIFWAADAENAVKLSCLRKAWCPHLGITYEEDLTRNISFEDENSSLEKFFLKIPVLW